MRRSAGPRQPVARRRIVAGSGRCLRRDRPGPTTGGLLERRERGKRRRGRPAAGRLLSLGRGFLLLLDVLLVRVELLGDRVGAFLGGSELEGAGARFLVL